MNKTNSVRVEIDTHKEVLAQRERQKEHGRKRRDNKQRRDTKWFDHFN